MIDRWARETTMKILKKNLMIKYLIFTLYFLYLLFQSIAEIISKIEIVGNNKFLVKL